MRDLNWEAGWDPYDAEEIYPEVEKLREQLKELEQDYQVLASENGELLDKIDLIQQIVLKETGFDIRAHLKQ